MAGPHVERKETASTVLLDVEAGEHGKKADQRFTETEPRRDVPAGDDPKFRILVLGDFSGRRDAGSARKPVMIDRDNFDDIMRAMNVRANLELGRGAIQAPLHFQELDDFEPDALYAKCALFRASEDAPVASESPLAMPAARPDASLLSSSRLLDDILEQSAAPEEPSRATPEDPLQSMIDRAVAPFRVPAETAAAKDARAQREDRNAVLMRAILGHPEFQALEAAWRAIYMLVRGLETDGDLKLYIWDVSKAALARDLGQTDVRGSELFRVVVEETVGTPDSEPWAVIAANYAFERNQDDIALLRTISSIAYLAGAPFLAESVPPDANDEAATQRWAELRKSPHANCIGLAMPRMILRLPYGRDTYPIESFPFEEMPQPCHSQYLWGNPAFACAYLLGKSFNAYGWAFQPGLLRKIDGLPFHTVVEGGETRSQPCAEILLSDREIEEILDEGVMVLASVKNQDAVVLPRFQSIADPPAALTGRWG